MGKTSVIIGLSIVAMCGTSADAEDQRPEATALHVLLTTAPQLTAVSRAALIAEATAVWHRAGVQLVWDSGSGARRAGSLRVLVIPRPASTDETAQDYVLGELVGLGGASALAIASIDSAERLIAGWHPPATVPQSLHEDRVGLVLGRTVAHEIGHHLLETRGHTQAGLMRATFAAHELLDRRSPAFDLDGASQTLLRHRIELRALPGVMADTGTD
jgi:hypothetical protein